ncbi:MAG: COX15/CtaA family protein, partial [Acidimicrobiia bacterium]
EVKGSQRRMAALTTGVAIIIEALLGAWLVLAELVADDASVMRAISVPVHLVNTFFLLGALTVTAWLLSGDRTFRWQGPDRRMISLGVLGLVLIGASGAVTALAGTLFPSESFAEGFARDFDATSHFLTRLRILHPIVAILSGVYLMTQAQRRKDVAPRLATSITGLVAVQWGVGFLNVVTLTPLAAQVIHLLLADLLLVAWVLFATELMQDADSRDSVEV